MENKEWAALAGPSRSAPDVCDTERAGRVASAAVASERPFVAVLRLMTAVAIRREFHAEPRCSACDSRSSRPGRAARSKRSACLPWSKRAPDHCAGCGTARNWLAKRPSWRHPSCDNEAHAVGPLCTPWSGGSRCIGQPVLADQVEIASVVIEENTDLEARFVVADSAIVAELAFVYVVFPVAGAACGRQLHLSGGVCDRPRTAWRCFPRSGNFVSRS